MSDSTILLRYAKGSCALGTLYVGTVVVPNKTPYSDVFSSKVIGTSFITFVTLKSCSPKLITIVLSLFSTS